MSITEQVTVTVADVEVTDEYRVAIRSDWLVDGVVIDMSPDQAMQLADELTERAMEAHAALKADLAERGVRSIPSGFDVDGPVAS